MRTTPSVRAITFDFGQTLADLDTALLARRLAERGLDASADRLEAGVPDAWRAYNQAIHATGTGHPWKLLMRHLLEGAGLAGSGVEPAIDWLWSEQPKHNLWRRPVPGMIDVVCDLCARGVPVGIISNSEGRLAELAAELGWADYFRVIADSGKLGIEKPAPPIFHYTSERLGVAMSEVVHVGDAYVADVEGARGVGAKAIWFRGSSAVEDASVKVCADAIEVRQALRSWGVPV